MVIDGIKSTQIKECCLTEMSRQVNKGKKPKFFTLCHVKIIHEKYPHCLNKQTDSITNRFQSFNNPGWQFNYFCNTPSGLAIIVQINVQRENHNGRADLSCCWIFCCTAINLYHTALVVRFDYDLLTIDCSQNKTEEMVICWLTGLHLQRSKTLRLYRE
jgi:hypothetical protein